MASVVVAVEDAVLGGILQAEIEGEGHSVQSAASGYDAYQLTLEQQPDFVFLGTKLPVYDGLTTCRMMRDDPELPKNMPIFLILGQEVDARALDEAGVTQTLPEQHESGQIREMLANYLANNRG